MVMERPARAAPLPTVLQTVQWRARSRSARSSTRRFIPFIVNDVIVESVEASVMTVSIADETAGTLASTPDISAAAIIGAQRIPHMFRMAVPLPGGGVAASWTHEAPGRTPR